MRLDDAQLITANHVKVSTSPLSTDSTHTQRLNPSRGGCNLLWWWYFEWCRLPERTFRFLLVAHAFGLVVSGVLGRPSLPSPPSSACCSFWEGALSMASSSVSRCKSISYWDRTNLSTFTYVALRSGIVFGGGGSAGVAVAMAVVFEAIGGVGAGAGVWAGKSLLFTVLNSNFSVVIAQLVAICSKVVISRDEPAF